MKESIKFQVCEKIAYNDSRLVSTDRKAYTEANKFSYYVICNTWVKLVYASSPQGSDILLDQLVVHGLIPTIKMLNNDAQYIIEGHSELASPLCKQICISINDVREVLQVLRFAKRFTPQCADLIEASSIADFKSVLNRVKMRARRGYAPKIVNELRDIISSVLTGLDLSDLPIDGFFSSGAVANTKRSLSHKFTDWWYPYFLDRMYPLGTRDKTAQLYGSIFPPEFHPVLKVAKVQAVPKSYKASRIIAMEDSTRQWMLQAIRCRMEQTICKNGYATNIPLGRQEVNQLRCYLGSVNKEYSTIDLSSASDTVSYALFASVFPTKLVDTVREWRSSLVDIDGTLYTAHMCATSGSAVCFPIESVMFYAIAKLATDYASLYLGIELREPVSYGDDIIVDSRACETTTDLLASLGFTVNADKTFTGDHPYRESCGVEFLDGVECTTFYYPRKVISRNIESVDSIIKLHNRLYHRYWDVHVFLKEVLRDMIPDRYFTTSTYDEWVDGYPTDMLDPILETQFVNEPYKRGSEHDGDKAAAHLVIEERPSGKAKAMPEMYYYVQYLLHGPMYDTELSRLLKVSTSRVQRDHCYSATEAVYALKKE